MNTYQAKSGTRALQPSNRTLMGIAKLISMGINLAMPVGEVEPVEPAKIQCRTSCECDWGGFYRSTGLFQQSIDGNAQFFCNVPQNIRCYRTFGIFYLVEHSAANADFFSELYLAFRAVLACVYNIRCQFVIIRCQFVIDRCGLFSNHGLSLVVLRRFGSRQAGCQVLEKIASGCFREAPKKVTSGGARSIVKSGV